MTAAVPHRRSNKRVWLTLACAVLGLAIVTSWLATREWLPSAELARQCEEALNRRDYREAGAYAARLLAAEPESREGVFLLARSQQQAGQWRDALQRFEEIPDDGSPLAVRARCAAGDLALFQLQRLTEAEQLFQRALEQDANSVDAHNRLAYLLGLQSRNWDALPHRLAVIRSETFTATDLYLISLGDRAMDAPDVIAPYFREGHPDLGAQLAWGRVCAERGETANAERLYQSVLTSPEHAPEALARWGLLLTAAGQTDQRAAWQVASRSSDDHPGVWFVRGLWASDRQEARAAARCFWEVIRRDPEHAAACYRLGQQLMSLERKADAAPFLERAQLLENYARAAELAYRVGDAIHLQQARESAERCGLLTEAWGWSRILSALPTVSASEAKTTQRLAALLPDQMTSRSRASSNPALNLDLSAWSWEGTSGIQTENPVGPSTEISPSAITFEESSAAAGIDIRFINGGDPERGLVHMYEITGGGVAVIDFDRDDWPDLYFPQGGTWAAGDQRFETDRLFRNQGEGTFIDVTQAAGIFENGFSQGASVGDFDADGFPDLYVLNSGQNHLFHNQGDGTFRDVTLSSGMNDADYSASAVLADFSGDGLPDIYVVNYLSGEDLWDRVCGGDDGIPRSCLPQSFPAATDRFLLNLGDGRFQDQTNESGLADLAGKGLGVIAARFDDEGRMSLYIANDVGPNFLLQNVAELGQPSPRFVDVGLAAGVALNGEGRSQSAMGVTAGDVNGDGSLDLFVANFEGETNTLYLQGDAMQFQDATVRGGLAGPRLDLVGWGTQFLDVDLDGWLDLAITNGHVNNLEDRGKPYHMPPLFYRNTGEGRMTLLPAESLGDYFTHSFLGRGMARIDWNRDGRDDLVVTHLDAPAALLTNRSQSSSHGIGLHLTGTHSERDAIGATVLVNTGTRVLMRQLTAGDGNQSSNERRLLFGLRAESHIESIKIQWPNGTTQQFGPLDIDRDYRVIEGRPEPYLMNTWP